MKHPRHDLRRVSDELRSAIDKAAKPWHGDADNAMQMLASAWIQSLAMSLSIPPAGHSRQAHNLAHAIHHIAQAFPWREASEGCMRQAADELGKP